MQLHPHSTSLSLLHFDIVTEYFPNTKSSQIVVLSVNDSTYFPKRSDILLSWLCICRQGETHILKHIIMHVDFLGGKCPTHLNWGTIFPSLMVWKFILTEDGISHRQEIIRFNFSFPLDAANEMSVKAQIGLCENRQSVSTYLLRSLAYD